MTFPVGDWFLGVGDGGIGRDKVPPRAPRHWQRDTTGHHGSRESAGPSCRRGFDNERPWQPTGCHQFARNIYVFHLCPWKELFFIDSPVLSVEGCEIKLKTRKSQYICCKNLWKRGP